MNAALTFLLANRIELIAFVLGVVNVTLVVRRSIWNYPFAIAMVALYAIVFYRTKLYSDALLQIFFFVVNFYGWWMWLRAEQAEGEIRVLLMTGSARARWLVGIAVTALLWAAAMHRWTDAAYPYWDAPVAIPSVAAQILMSRRLLENWVLWIAVDILAIGLYATKGLWLTTVLYVIFLGLAIWGLAHWHHVRRAAGPSPA
ncbi:nicotinamide riboside transporter PnuC [soil metagenome]